MSLKYKIIILFLVIILIPLNLLGMITYHQYSQTLEKQTYNYSTQIIDQINQNINQYIEELHRMTLLPLYDRDVLKILNNHQDHDTYYYPHSNETEKMNSFISTLAYKRSEIKGIQIITNNQNIFSNVGSPSVKARYLNIENEPWYETLIEGDGQSQIIDSHIPSYYLGHPEAVFSVGRVIRKLNTFEHMGIIKIDIHLNYIKEIMEETHFSQDAIVLILDKQGNLIYQQIGNGEGSNDIADTLIQKNKQSVNEEINEILTKVYNDPDKAIINHGDRAYLPIINNIPTSDIQSIVLIPEEEILEASKTLRIFTLYLILVCIIITVILALIVTQKITSPIIQLRNKMVLAEKGYFNQKVAIHSNDEIGELSNGFNKMMDEINKLIQQVYQTEIREKDAEIKALQSQMNPHFIYNTLESINMMAIIHKKYEISDMISSLGKLIRYTVSQKDSLIGIKEEIEFVESYLNIQQLRFGESLEVSINMPDQFLKAFIPKLALQPIIENALVHGLENANRPGKITVDCWKENETLFIRIIDTGKGMDPEQLNKLWERLNLHGYSEDEENSGVALKNIHERIKLLFGDRYGLKVMSELNKGTEIIIVLPYRLNREEF